MQGRSRATRTVGLGYKGLEERGEPVTRWTLPLLLLGAACAPPPEPGGTSAASIELIHPSPSEAELALDLTGRLAFLVAVDIDGIEFLTPGSNDQNVEGEGHYHFTLNGVYIGAPAERAYEYVSEIAEFRIGQEVSLRVSLQGNDHRDLDQFADWEDIAEFTVAGPRNP